MGAVQGPGRGLRSCQALWSSSRGQEEGEGSSCRVRFLTSQDSDGPFLSAQLRGGRFGLGQGSCPAWTACASVCDPPLLSTANSILMVPLGHREAMVTGKCRTMQPGVRSPGLGRGWGRGAT